MKSCLCAGAAERPQKSQLSKLLLLLPPPRMMIMIMMMMANEWTNVNGKLAENQSKSKLFQHLQFDWRPFHAPSTSSWSSFHAQQRNAQRGDEKRVREISNAPMHASCLARCSLLMPYRLMQKNRVANLTGAADGRCAERTCASSSSCIHREFMSEQIKIV